MATAPIDDNTRQGLIAVSNADGSTIVPLYADPTTHRLLVDLPGGAGTVTAVSVVSANGLAGSVATSTTTPAITLSTTVTGIVKGNGTALSAAAAGTDYVAPGGALGTPSSGTLTNTTGLPIVGGTTGTLSVARGGTGVTTIAGLSIWVANSADTITSVTPGAGQSIRINGAGNAWEVFTPSASVPTTITVANEAADTTCFVGFFTAATGDLGPKTNASLTFNSSTGAFAATSGTFGSILASTNDSGALGASGTAFSDLFLASGGVINWSVGDVTITHSANALAFAGASSGYSFDDEILPSANDGAGLGAPTISWSDLFLASGAVISFANNNTVLTHSSGVLTVSTGDLRVTTAGTNTASVVTVGGTQTLTAKTLTSPAITTATLSGTQLLAEGASVGLDPSPSADGVYSGTTVTGTAGATLAFGDLIYLDPTDSRWELADANAASGADGDSRGILGICVQAAAADGSATTILLNGIVRADAAFPALTVNNPVYVSETAGDITQTQPTTTDVVIRIVGVAFTADSIYFNPDHTWITHT